MSLDIKYNTDGLVPAIVQDANTHKVLMLGYMNQEALDLTLTSQQVVFFSRSKQRLWKKGETSGHVLKLVEVRADCDKDTLLVRAVPAGETCHLGTATCWGEDNEPDFLMKLEKVIQAYKNKPKLGSYTSDLLLSGINKVSQKVGEEAVELVIEAKDNNEDLFLGEAADLLYHYLVLLAAKGHSLDEVVEVLKKRERV